MEEAIGGVIILAIIVCVIVGGIKTFQRNWLAALLLLILLFPIWIIWAFVELFTGKIDSTNQPTNATQNVHVTVINQNDGAAPRIAKQSDEELNVIDADILGDKVKEINK